MNTQISRRGQQPGLLAPGLLAPGLLAPGLLAPGRPAPGLAPRRGPHSHRLVDGLSVRCQTQWGGFCDLQVICRIKCRTHINTRTKGRPIR